MSLHVAIARAALVAASAAAKLARRLIETKVDGPWDADVSQELDRAVAFEEALIGKK